MSTNILPTTLVSDFMQNCFQFWLLFTMYFETGDFYFQILHYENRLSLSYNKLIMKHSNQNINLILIPHNTVAFLFDDAEGDAGVCILF